MANLIPDQEQIAWGVVYQIDEVDIGRLDNCEGFQPGRDPAKNSYNREERHVYRGKDEQPLLVSLYFAVPQEGAPFLPHPDYKRLIVEGAKFWHLPDQYISQLEKIETMSAESNS